MSVRNTRGVTGFVRTGKQSPCPFSEEEMYHMGISHGEVQVDFEEGDNVAVISGVWEGTVGTIQSINQSKQSVTIHVDMFGRETRSS